MFGVTPKDVEKMMKKLGMNVENLDAEEVIINTKDGKVIRILNPLVQKIVIQGVVSFQIQGEVKEKESVDEEAVQIVMEKTKVDRDKAISVLKSCNWDIAEAILKLSGGEE